MTAEPDVTAEPTPEAPEAEAVSYYTPADGTDAAGQSSAGPPVAAAGAILPSGFYDFEDSVANSLRAEARGVAGDALSESYQSGIYDNQSADFLERTSFDEVADLAINFGGRGGGVHARFNKRGLAVNFGRKIAFVRDADDLIADAERIENFGSRRKQGDDAHGAMVAHRRAIGGAHPS